MDKIKDLIRTLVTEVLLREKLRGTFNFTQFKNLAKTADSEKLYEYLLGTLGRPIGEGSSRTVWVLSSNKVLKLAYDQSWINKPGAGLAQNEAEVEVATNPKVQKVVATVYESDPNYKWIISELTKPLTTQDLKHITGLEQGQFEELLRKSLDFDYQLTDAIRILKASYLDSINIAQKRLEDYESPGWRRSLKDYQDTLEQLNNINIELLKPVIDGIVAMKKEFGFDVGDLIRYDHYGKTADGRLVVIDYGYTPTIGRTFYR